MEIESCALLAYIGAFQSVQMNYDVLKYMVNSCNIKEVDSDGFTPLILASIAVPHADLVKVLRLLLNAGADAVAVQNQGQNVLQKLVQKLSSCYFSPLVLHKPEEIVDVLVRLIQSGAKPDLGTEHSWTPFESALMPASFTLWCQSLCRVELDIRNLLEHEDSVATIPTPDFAQTDDALGEPHQPRILTEYGIGKEKFDFACPLCGQTEWNRAFRFPFDIFQSSNFGDYGYHTLIHNHNDGQLCRNWSESPSCTHHEHISYPGRLTPVIFAKDMSIRKWAAYQLWQDGFLNTPKEALEWASNVMTQEAYDSWGHLALIWLSVFE